MPLTVKASEATRAISDHLKSAYEDNIEVTVKGSKPYVKIVPSTTMPRTARMEPCI